MVDLALAWGARRVEIAHAQYYGWAITNRAALMPDRAEAEAAIAAVERRREALAGRIVIDHVLPDYYASRPKACMGGWGRRSLNVTPVGQGAALPCRRDAFRGWSSGACASTRWRRSGATLPAFNAFRGTDWMKEPCRTCDRREVDFGRLPLPGDDDRRRSRGKPTRSASSRRSTIAWRTSRPKGSPLPAIAYTYRTMKKLDTGLSAALAGAAQFSSGESG